MYQNTVGSVDKRRSSDVGVPTKKSKRKSVFNNPKSKLNIKTMKKKKSANDSKNGLRSRSFVGPEKTSTKKPKNKKKKTQKEYRGKSQSEKLIKKVRDNYSDEKLHTKQ